MRSLTGRWYLKRTWFGNFVLMVEVFVQTYCPYDLSLSPGAKVWEKATNQDILELKIPTL